MPWLRTNQLNFNSSTENACSKDEFWTLRRKPYLRKATAKSSKVALIQVFSAGSDCSLLPNKDIPANVVAVGNPCRVLREINDRDKEYYFRDKKIDFDLEKCY